MENRDAGLGKKSYRRGFDFGRTLLRCIVIVVSSAFLRNANGAEVPPKTLAQLLAPVLSQAHNRTVRIVMGGTSIAAGGISNNQLFVSQLMSVYGDARSYVQPMGSLGGSWDLPAYGWLKQPYSGPSLVRLRGSSSSQTLPLSRYGSRIIVEYSTENDGGVSEIFIDGVSFGTIDCMGEQRLSNRVSFNVPVGLHDVTIKPPTNGYVYLERLLFEQDAPGIALIDGTLGGTGLDHVYNSRPRGGQTIQGIPTQPGVGTAAFFRRPDTDILIWSGPVNDNSGNNPPYATWKARMDEMVESARNRCPLILIAEMGGHLGFPNDSAHALFKAQYEYFLQLARDNPHVYTLDWHGATFDPDIQAYSSKYYTYATYDPQTGRVSGDFIHPNVVGHRVATAMFTRAAGLPIPLEDSCLEVRDRVRRTSPLPPGTAIAFTERNVSRNGVSTIAGSSVFTASNDAHRLPLLFAPEVENLTQHNTAIANATNSEKYGKYLDYPQLSWLQVLNNVQIGEKVTVTALVKSRQPYLLASFQHIYAAPVITYAGANLGPKVVIVTYAEAEPPLWVTFEYTRDKHSYIAFSGRLYSLSITRTNGQPVAHFNPPITRQSTIESPNATELSSQNMKFRISANPQNDGPLSVRFEYGLQEDLKGAKQTMDTVIPNGWDHITALTEATGLLPGKIYFFRSVINYPGEPQSYPVPTQSFLAPPLGGPPTSIALKRLASGKMLLAMFGPPNRDFVVKQSSDLSNWTPLVTVNSGPFGNFTYEDPKPQSSGQRYYRLFNQ